MNKNQLITRVQRLMGAGTSRSTAQAAVNAVLDSILQGAKEDKVHIPHLGCFEYMGHDERSAYDIFAALAGASCTTRRLAFRPARRLRERTLGSKSARLLPADSGQQAEAAAK